MVEVEKIVLCFFFALADSDFFYPRLPWQKLLIKLDLRALFNLGREAGLCDRWGSRYRIEPIILSVLLLESIDF